MQFGRLWLACEFAQSLPEKLLVLDIDVLVAKEDDAALRDCRRRVLESETFSISVQETFQDDLV